MGFLRKIFVYAAGFGRTDMAFTNRSWQKWLVGLVLIALAAGASILLKETMDSFDPDNALPSLVVSAGEASVPVHRAGYEWFFFTTTKKTPILSPDDLPLLPTVVMPQAPLKLRFSRPYVTLRISRADGLHNPNFAHLQGDNHQTPRDAGVYVYKVESGFNHGSILYYFAVEVK